MRTQVNQISGPYFADNNLTYKIITEHREIDLGKGNFT